MLPIGPAAPLRDRTRPSQAEELELIRKYFTQYDDYVLRSIERVFAGTMDALGSLAAPAGPAAAPALALGGPAALALPPAPEALRPLSAPLAARPEWSEVPDAPDRTGGRAVPGPPPALWVDAAGPEAEAGPTQTAPMPRPAAAAPALPHMPHHTGPFSRSASQSTSAQAPSSPTSFQRLWGIRTPTSAGGGGFLLDGPPLVPDEGPAVREGTAPVDAGPPPMPVGDPGARRQKADEGADPAAAARPNRAPNPNPKHNPDPDPRPSPNPHTAPAGDSNPAARASRRPSRSNGNPEPDPPPLPTAAPHVNPLAMPNGAARPDPATDRPSEPSSPSSSVASSTAARVPRGNATQAPPWAPPVARPASTSKAAG